MPKIDRRTLMQAGAAGAAITVLATAAEAAPAEGLFVIAEIVAAPGKADEMRALLTAFTDKARAEPGCKSYTLLEVQGEPGRFLTFEKWTDKTALDAHMSTPDIKDLVPKVTPLLAKPFTIAAASAINA